MPGTQSAKYNNLSDISFKTNTTAKQNKLKSNKNHGGNLKIGMTRARLFSILVLAEHEMMKETSELMVMHRISSRH